MKVTKYKSRKLPSWELRTPKFRKEYAASKKYSRDPALEEIIRKCRPGDSFINFKPVSQVYLQHTAIACGTFVVVRQVMCSGKRVQRVWVIYPTLTPGQIDGTEYLKKDTEGPCVPGWDFPAGRFTYPRRKYYDEELAKRKSL